jgi:cytochrome c biogenesis protein
VNGSSSATLPDGSSMHIVEATDDVSPFAPGLTGPAAQVEIHTPQGGSEMVVVYANHPDLNERHAREHNGGPVLQYKGAQKRMYTGLQVAKDPGVWVVWLGCLLMVVGIYAAFFVSHRRIWVRIQNSAVTIGGNASKNQGAFRQYLDGLVEKLNRHLSTEEHQ